MKAEELRIGNWVEWEDGDKDIIEIDAVSICGGVSGMSEEGSYITEIKYINPIPLTKEWLLKFGFNVPEGYPLAWGKGRLRVNVGNQKTWLYGDEPIIDIKYVHQLQNLYFTLTGEELKIIEE